MMSHQFSTITDVTCAANCSTGCVDDSSTVHSTSSDWLQLHHCEGLMTPNDIVDALLPLSSNQVSFHLNSFQTGNDTSLPEDPRRWSRADVHVWLHTMHVSDVDAERFRMNGKALCLMTSEMFAYRVPVGGKRLFKDFRQRLCQALLLPVGEAAWWREEQ